MASITTSFTGTLNSNKWLSNLYNAYKYVLTLTGNLKFDNKLTDMWREEFDLFHDKYVITDTDVLDFSKNYDSDLGSDQLNVLAVEQKGTVKQQELGLNINKYLGFTSGMWLKKQVWTSPDVFEDFESALLAQQMATIRLYEEQMVKQTIGCALKGDGDAQNISIAFETSTGTGVTDESTAVTTTYTMTEDLNRLNAEKFFAKISNLLIDMAEPSRDYNDNGFYHNEKPENLVMIVNSKYYTDFMKVAPIMMRESSTFKSIFDNCIVLHEKYFGINQAKGETASSTYFDASSKKIKSDYQGKVRFADEVTIGSGANAKNYKISEKVPNDTEVVDSDGDLLYDLYVVDDTKICKLFAKDGVKYYVRIDGEQETFRNPKGRVENYYSFYEAARPMIIAGKPCVTISKS